MAFDIEHLLQQAEWYRLLCDQLPDARERRFLQIMARSHEVLAESQKRLDELAR